MQRRHSGWIIILTFIASFLLSIMPWPPQFVYWRPDWTALILIYWTMKTPQTVGLLSGWLSGLIHDLLNDTLLGQQALSYSLIAYLMAQIQQRLRLYPRWQQAVVVGGLIAVRNLINLWFQILVGYSFPDDWTWLYPALTSMILWPWLYLVLQDISRTHHLL